jgi:hypothetical protein
MVGQIEDQESRIFHSAETNFSVDTTGLLMEAVTKGSGTTYGLFEHPAKARALE